MRTLAGRIQQQTESRVVKKNDKGEIITDKEMQTDIPGVFAAGDVNDGEEKQIIVAAGEGCVALLNAVRYIQKL